MLIEFGMPKNLNGEELVAELLAIGVVVTGRPQVGANQDLWLDIAETDKSKTAVVVAAHNGNMIPREPTVAEKLESVGLSIPDLKTALGL